MIHFLVPFEILPLVCKIEIILLLCIYVLSSVLCRGVCVGVWVCGCVGVWDLVCGCVYKIENLRTLSAPSNHVTYLCIYTFTTY
jgi:hypothetical protein